MTSSYLFSLHPPLFLALITLLFHHPQRGKLTKSTPMTPELFFEWKRKRMEEREAGLAAQRAERAKNDRMRYSSPVCPHSIG